MQHEHRENHEDRRRISSIYSGLNDQVTSQNLFSGGRASAVSALFNLTRSESGVVNPAYADDDDDDNNDVDDIDDDTEGTSEYTEGSNTRARSEIYSSETEAKTIANGHIVIPTGDVKVNFDVVEPAKSAPIQHKKSYKQKKSWDRFESSTEDNISNDDVLFWNQVFVVTKIIVAILLFLIVFGTAVVTKICFIISTTNLYGQQYMKTAQEQLKFPSDNTNVMWVWSLMMMMGAPYFFTVYSCLWKLCTRLGGLKLNWKALLWVLLLETLHSVGLNVLVYVLVPSLDPASGLLLMLNVAIVPSFLKTLNPRSKKKQKKYSVFLSSFLGVFAVCGQLGSLALWCYYIYQTNTDPDIGMAHKIEFMVAMVLAPLFISATWWENFTIDAREGGTAEGRRTGLRRLVRKTRTKVSLIVNLWKLCLTFILPMAIFGLRCHSASQDCIDVLFLRSDSSKYSVNQPLYSKLSNLIGYKTGFFSHCDNYLPLIVAAIAIVSSGVCYKACKTACKIMTQVSDFSIPLVFTTPTALGIVLAMYSGFLGDSKTSCSIPFPTWSNNVEILDIVEKFWIPAAAGLVSYLSLMLVTNYIWSPGPDRLQTTRRLFVMPLYCGVLMEQSLLLNRRREESERDVTDAGKKKHRELPLPEINDSILSDTSISPFRTEDTPMIYMCATMWHETDFEMVQLLKSIFRMDEDQCTRRNTQLMLKRRDKDYYEFEAHIFFDDAFEGHTDDENEFSVNGYVRQLMKTIPKSSREVHPHYLMPPPTKIATPYGGRLVWKLRGGNVLVAHLKDKAVIRHKKRWSQVMYMYYFLAHKLLKRNLSSRKLRKAAHNTYILALDGDVDFQPRAVQLLLDRMRKNEDVGAACGRIHPIGAGAMVWYQKFEYAVSHWLQKAAEDKFGCVLCSPGCFSLFRGSSLMSENVMHKYTTVASEARHYVQYDQGEDRWLCTLLLQQGHRVEYCAASDALTYAPEGFGEFFNQRRRWTPSTMANIMDLLSDWRNVIKKNADISITYIFYQGLLMVSSILTPGTIFLMVLGALNLAYPEVQLWMALFINLLPIAILVFLCFFAKGSTQITYAAVLSVAYSLIMMVVIVGLLRQVADYGLCSVTSAFLLFVAGVFVIAAFVHPQEFSCIFHGFLYFLSIPSMSLVLMLYSLCNLHVVSWGTRENNSPNVVTQQKKKPTKAGVAGWLDKQFGDETSSWFEQLCFCCTSRPRGDHVSVMLDKLDEIENRIMELSTQGTSRMTGNSPRNVSVRSTPTITRFQENADQFEINVERENPLFQREVQIPRDQLNNPYWLEDPALIELAESEREHLCGEEINFFNELIEDYLKPLVENKEHQKKVSEDLKELRNKVCLIFILLNALFIIIVFTLQQVTANARATGTKALSIKLPCASDDGIGQSIEPISVAFTLVFGVLLLVQFVCMLFHRLATLTHVCASTEIFKKRVKLSDGPTSKEVTFQEGYRLVQEMQKPQIDEDAMSVISGSSLSGESVIDDDLDEMVSAAEENRKKSAKKNWRKLTLMANRTPSAGTSESLTANFMESVKTISKTVEDDGDEESTSAYAPKTSNWNKFKNRETLKRVVGDSSLKENLNNLNNLKSLNMNRWQATALKNRVLNGANGNGSAGGAQPRTSVSMLDIAKLEINRRKNETISCVLEEEDEAAPVCNSTPGTPLFRKNGPSSRPSPRSSPKLSPETVADDVALVVVTGAEGSPSKSTVETTQVEVHTTEEMDHVDTLF